MALARITIMITKTFFHAFKCVYHKLSMQNPSLVCFRSDFKISTCISGWTNQVTIQMHIAPARICLLQGNNLAFRSRCAFTESTMHPPLNKSCPRRLCHFQEDTHLPPWPAALCSGQTIGQKHKKTFLELFSHRSFNPYTNIYHQSSSRNTSAVLAQERKLVCGWNAGKYLIVLLCHLSSAFYGWAVCNPRDRLAPIKSECCGSSDAAAFPLTER